MEQNTSTMDNQTAQQQVGESYFDGTLLQEVGLNLVCFFASLLTFGLAYPWLMCMVMRWHTKHTVIDGRRLYFDGTGAQLFGNWVKWMLLTLITLGIYGFWLQIALEQWKTKHTHMQAQNA